MVSLPKVWKQTSNLPVHLAASSLAARAVLLFDIDGVIRDVAASYRRAIVETVHQFSGWRPEPAQIDALKSEGCWNNDWEASLELLRRHRLAGGPTQGEQSAGEPFAGKRSSGDLIAMGSAGASPGRTGSASHDLADLPNFDTVVSAFCGHYFGGDPEGDPTLWQGFIGQEPLLVGPQFFTDLSAAGILWGFVSGAEPPSVRYVLQRRLGLENPPFIAMGDAPDKPDPTGVLRLASELLAAKGTSLGAEAPPVVYLGDTVADVQTVLRARQRLPDQRFLSLAVSPPHLHGPEQQPRRSAYEQQLLAAGADRILSSSDQAGQVLEALLA
ncbi:MAG: TIGR01548 family HAD-type hydrolase [Synechococcaceae cyanobacterium ELA739]